MRGAIFGDVLSKLLSKTGFIVTKEYYVNDLGTQVENLAISLKHHLKNYVNSENLPMTENMYKGEYLKKIAEKLIKSPSFNIDDFEKLKEYAVENNLDLIKKDLSDLGVSFNNYISEKKIHDNGLMENVYKILKK